MISTSLLKLISQKKRPVSWTLFNMLILKPDYLIHSWLNERPFLCDRKYIMVLKLFFDLSSDTKVA